jgi:DNA-binding response OmpR family regulator
LKARILLVESEGELRERLHGLLRAEGFEVAIVEVSEAGFLTAVSGEFDLIVLDSPPAICDELRRKGVDASILMLTEERVTGLRLGADDCVPHACDSSELLARIEALLRRVPRARRMAASTLRLGNLEIDFRTAQIRKAGRILIVAQKELRLLQYLVEHRERIVSRKEILRQVWEYDSAVSSRTVDVHIGWLRQKLEDDPQHPKYIKTIRCRGYRFDLEESPSKLMSSWRYTPTPI